MQTRTGKLGDRIRSLPRDEAGSITIFSLIIFVLILMCAGMAVDMMRYERERTGLQNAMDSGVIAASSLNQGADPTLLVKDYVAKAGYNPDLVTVTPVTSEIQDDMRIMKSLVSDSIRLEVESQSTSSTRLSLQANHLTFPFSGALLMVRVE